MGSGCLVCDHEYVTTVLIVDDHPSFRATARALLEAEGFDVLGEASDGRAAIEAAEELRPTSCFSTCSCPIRQGSTSPPG